jgi:hypothetical protein
VNGYGHHDLHLRHRYDRVSHGGLLVASVFRGAGYDIAGGRRPRRTRGVLCRARSNGAFLVAWNKVALRALRSASLEVADRPIQEPLPLVVIRQKMKTNLHVQACSARDGIATIHGPVGEIRDSELIAAALEQARKDASAYEVRRLVAVGTVNRSAGLKTAVDIVVPFRRQVVDPTVERFFIMFTRRRFKVQ